MEESKSTILIVDDEVSGRDTLEAILEPEGYILVMAENGYQALEKAVQIKPDVILLDVMMPEQDGWNILAQWRHHPATQAIPVVICTILPQEALASLLGAAAFLKKPVSREAVLALLEGLVVSSLQTPG